uniref:putative F-box only protein 15 n=1 Tax=Erigeron canadensis TaxID=72917 RepID=UPI001CB89294|nr:putative F-box only protein 15 [Erigeron canadensis]
MADHHRRHKIPTHIIFFHILPRLSVDSLQRCKRVCKEWDSFLETRFFVNMHIRHYLLTNGSTYQPRPKFLFLNEKRFRIIDCEAPCDGLKDHGHALPFEANLRSIDIQTSLHGLVCVGGWFGKSLFQRDDYFDLVLWNPLTGQYKMLCKTHRHIQFDFSEVIALLGLYYCDDDYKLLTVSSNASVRIYSLKSDSWRWVDSTNNYQTLLDLGLGTESPPKISSSSSIWLSGNLYFLTKSYQRFPGSSARDCYSILKFDSKMEYFTVIPTHPSLKALDLESVRMNVQKGVIHLGAKYKISLTKAYIQLWEMIGDETWEKVYVETLCNDDIHMNPLH